MQTTHTTVPTENQLSRIILDAAFRIHTKTGPGLLESVYEAILAQELRQHGLHVERQVPIPIRYEGSVFDEGFRADLLIEGKVIVELKSVEQLVPVNRKQLLTQLRLSGLRLGLLLNFGEAHLKDGLERVVNGLPDDRVPARAEGAPGPTRTATSDLTPTAAASPTQNSTARLTSSSRGPQRSS